MVTYNQQAYVVEALSSVLNQQTSFEFELVIGEDCSTDSTREVIETYIAGNPTRVRIVPRPRNVGARINFTETIGACEGDYIAIVDGDDYWTSTQKLQRQVDFLEANPNCSMCFHAVEVVYEDGGKFARYPPGRQPLYTLTDLVRGNFITTCSLMVRRGLFSGYPKWFSETQLAPGDWVFAIMLAQHGDIGYIDEIMGAYRVHEGGMWSSMNPSQRIGTQIELLNYIDSYLQRQYTDLIQRRVRVMRQRQYLTEKLPVLVPIVEAFRKLFLRGPSPR